MVTLTNTTTSTPSLTGNSPSSATLTNTTTSTASPTNQTTSSASASNQALGVRWQDATYAWSVAGTWASTSDVTSVTNV